MATNIIITRATAGIVETAGHAHAQAWAAAGVGVVFAGLLFKPFFRDWSGFWECIKFLVTPDWFSLWRGEWLADQWAQLKLGVWLLVSGGCGILCYVKLPTWLPGMFG